MRLNKAIRQVYRANNMETKWSLKSLLFIDATGLLTTWKETGQPGIPGRENCIILHLAPSGKGATHFKKSPITGRGRSSMDTISDLKENTLRTGEGVLHFHRSPKIKTPHYLW